MSEYSGYYSIELASGISPKNNGDFPLIRARDVLMPDGRRLSDWTQYDGKVSIVYNTITFYLRTDDENTPEAMLELEATYGTSWGEWIDLSANSDFSLEGGHVVYRGMSVFYVQGGDEPITGDSTIIDQHTYSLI